MSRRIDLEKKEMERRFRRSIFLSCFTAVTLIASGLIIWKLKSLLLPIAVGALLAYLFRPLKDRFRVPWIHPEIRVLMLFAVIGGMIYFGVSNIRKQFPSEKEKLELKVRLKYKLNEKFQQLIGAKDPAGQSAVSHLIAKEAGPMMDQLNRLLELEPKEIDLFVKYKNGHKGEAPIEARFVQYFKENLKVSSYAKSNRLPASVTGDGAGGAAVANEPEPVVTAKDEHSSSLHHEITIWMLAPIMFIFLGFDHGQLRKYFIGLVPNRYFELSLTVFDMLDEAIGAYLRGTLLECVLVGMTLTLGFFLVGIPLPMAIAIGLLSGLVNAIPFLGTVFGLVIGLGYALIAESVTPVLPGLNPEDLPLYVIILIALVHLIDNVVFQPFVLGGAVSLHPLVVIVAIIGGSLLGGIWGMLFAIPLVVILKTAVETLFKELKDYRII